VPQTRLKWLLTSLLFKLFNLVLLQNKIFMVYSVAVCLHVGSFKDVFCNFWFKIRSCKRKNQILYSEGNARNETTQKTHTVVKTVLAHFVTHANFTELILNCCVKNVVRRGKNWTYRNRISILVILSVNIWWRYNIIP